MVLDYQFKWVKMVVHVRKKLLEDLKTHYAVSKGIIVHWGENKSLSKLGRKFEYKRLLYD